MKKRVIKCKIFCMFLLFLFTGFALATNENVIASASQDNTWNYTQEILVNESAGKDLKDYPISIYLNSSNFNFSKAESKGSDIRFFSENKTLDYWIETWDLENQEAIIWVKVPSIPAHGTSKILMEYGNSRAKAASDGKKTFDFFDSFEGGTFSSLDWNTKGNGGGTIKVEDGVCKVLAPKVHAHDYAAIYSRGDFGINCMFVVKRMKVTTGTDNRGPLLQQGFIDRIDNSGNEIKHETELSSESRVSWEMINKDQRQKPYDLTDTSVPEGSWYVSGIAWYEENNSRKIAWFKDGIRYPKMDYASNNFITNSPMHVYLYAATNPDSSDNTGYMAVDYVLVRKFFGAEPTVDVVPAEIWLNSKPGSNNESSAHESESQVQKSQAVNQTGNQTRSQIENQTGDQKGTSDAGFPKYNVNISGIKLSAPNRFESSSLIKELNSSGINTIFLNVDPRDIWQCERFVKAAHEQRLSVHAVLFEDLNCSEKEATNACQESLDAVLDYNRKSLAPFDGINIYINPVNKTGSEDIFNYSTLFETARQKAGNKMSLSVSIPPYYSTSKIEKISPFVDFFVVRAYCGGLEGLNSASTIIDAVAPQMGEIRGDGSKGLIEVSVDKGFEDRTSIQKLFAELADYYSKDAAFKGVSICDFDTYASLPVKADPEKKESQIPGLAELPKLPELPRIPGFGALSMLILFLGASGILKSKRKMKGK